MMKRLKRLVTVVLLVVVGLVLKHFGLIGDGPGRTGLDQAVPVEAGKFTPMAPVPQGWDLLTDCTLIHGKNSDGDSFHVKTPKGDYEFRLYFIDTPESQFKTYRGGDSNGKRLDEQGEYFGLSRAQAESLGAQAKSFTLGLLKEQPFKILTKYEGVYGPQRKYCFVIVTWEGQQVYLHELLVAQGLGRIHTRGANLPGGRSWKVQKARLKEWEQEVREKGVGGWGPRQS